MEHISRLNRAVYRAERAFVAYSLLAMAFVVFLDVTHRTFSGERSKGVEAFLKVLGWFVPSVEPGSSAYESGAVVAPWIMFAAFSLLGWAAARAATRGSLPHARAAAWGVGGTVVIYGLAQLLIRVMPNGMVWSQPVALVLTLWVAFIGASMATYEHKHLKVEAVVRKLPVHLRNNVGAVSAWLSAAFCFGLMWVSIRYVLFNYEEYVATGGQGGMLPGLSLPKYAAYLALPMSFGTMCARFIGVGVLSYQGKLKDEDPLAGLVDDATKEALAAAAAPPPSDIPTEAVRPIRDLEVAPPKSSPRPSAAAGDVVTNRPSEVTTDRHATPGSAPAADAAAVKPAPADDDGGAQ